MVDAYFQEDPPDDVHWLINPTTRPGVAADIRESLRTYDGFCRDNVAWGGQWDIDPSAVAPPTLLWYGDKDLMVPVEHGHWHAENIPHATLVIRPGKGHFAMLLEFVEDTFATLRPLAG